MTEYNASTDSGWRRQPSLASACLLEQAFGTLSDLIAAYGAERSDHPAIVTDAGSLSYGELDVFMDRVGASLIRDGLAPGDVVAFCAAGSAVYFGAFLGACRVGIAPAPLPASVAPDDLAAMIADSGAKLILLDAMGAAVLDRAASAPDIPRIALADDRCGEPLSEWLAAQGARPPRVQVLPEAPFNIIYSSGTTGAPKGIVQPHRMRWAHIQRGALLRYSPESVTLVATQPYSNLTLVNLIGAIGAGGTVVFQPSFDARAFLEAAQSWRVSHTMLVPIQYRRILDLAEFDQFDLSAFTMKVVAGAPCSKELKEELLRRWPGELVDLFGMTEGGGACLLFCAQQRDKLHTVGRAQPGHEILVIREDGSLAEQGEAGEVVGRSASMMTGYHNQPEKTLEVEWRDADGRRFIRTGDVGFFDPDGFLVLTDRKKDMIISGGFNIYPSDLEAVLRRHPDVDEAAVVGAPSARWGETPVAFITGRAGADPNGAEIMAWANSRLGKTQRLAALEVLSSLPRSAIEKVLKRDLRDRAAEILASADIGEPK